MWQGKNVDSLPSGESQVFSIVHIRWTPKPKWSGGRPQCIHANCQTRRRRAFQADPPLIAQTIQMANSDGGHLHLSGQRRWTMRAVEGPYGRSPAAQRTLVIRVCGDEGAVVKTNEMSPKWQHN